MRESPDLPTTSAPMHTAPTPPGRCSLHRTSGLFRPKTLLRRFPPTRGGRRRAQIAGPSTGGFRSILTSLVVGAVLSASAHALAAPQIIFTIDVESQALPLPDRVH